MSLTPISNQATASIDPVDPSGGGLTASSIRDNAVTGIKAFGLRTFASQILRLISALCLARLLFPADYGIFSVAAYIAGLGMFLGDIGLSAALVREKNAPTDDETFTVFVCHQILTTTIVAILLIGAPLLTSLYKTPIQTAPLLMVMAAGLFFTSLRIIPMMALERQLRFTKIAQCELAENLAQTFGTIGLAALSLGPWALAGGGLIRGAVGLAVIWSASPWQPRGKFRWSIVRRLARFGISFQLNAIAPSLFGAWLPLIVSRHLGVVALGLSNWASLIASVPAMLGGVLSRVAFSSYSRLQDDPTMFGHYLQTSVRRLSGVLWPMISIGVLLLPIAVPWVFGNRWNGAIELAQWFTIASVPTLLVGLIASAQNATGRAGERLIVTVVVGLLGWTLGISSVWFFGLSSLGPSTLFIAFLELIITAFLVEKQNPSCCGLLRDSLIPSALAILLLGASIWIGQFLTAFWHVDILAFRFLICVSTFSILFLVCEFIPGRVNSIAEFKALVRLISPRGKAHRGLSS